MMQVIKLQKNKVAAVVFLAFSWLCTTAAQADKQADSQKEE